MAIGKLSITNYNFKLPRLCVVQAKAAISPRSQIALVADSIRYGSPPIMGVTRQAANTLISPITSRLRGCLSSKVKVSGAIVQKYT